LTPSTGLRRSGLDDLRTWEQDSSRADSVKTGVWEATPGENRSIKGETFEYCHILSGAGDSFVMKPGHVRVWKTIETIALEQLVSLKRSKTRTSCEVLDDFSTFYRAPDAMKG
jgi:uncharacterized cupin superfamily protein